jgi:hypothetical protein
MKFGAMLIGVRHRTYGLVGTDRGTHTAANTHLIDFGILANADKMAVFVAAFLFQDIQFGHPLPTVGQVDSLLRANRSTLPAQGTAILTVLYDPGQVAIS